LVFGPCFLVVGLPLAPSFLNTRRKQMSWHTVVSKGKEPASRSSHSIVCQGTKLFLFGGEDTPTHPFDPNLHQYDFSTNEWTVIEPAANQQPTDHPGLRLAHSLSIIGNSIYLFGGRDGNATELGDLFRFDLEKKIWQRINDAVGDIPSPRSYHVSTAIGTHLYIFGGCTKDGRSNDLFQFDTVNRVWRKMPTEERLKPRGGPALASSSEKLYIHAGFNSQELDDLWEFDTKDEKWRLITEYTGDAPSPRSVHCMVRLENDTLFVFGGEKQPSTKGHLGAGIYHSDSYVLDLKSMAWMKVSETSQFSPRGWIAAHSLGSNSVVLFGGYDGIQRLNDLHIWK